jgi:patatin-like phospholipase/acyl hydrolase
VELKHKVAITSFDALNARPVVFKTKYHSLLTAYGELNVVDVALATSAAPTYFPAAQFDDMVMIDGGGWANCPVMVAITEALSLFEQRIEDIHILSIGTTSSPEFIQKKAWDGGLLRWARPMPSLLMHAAGLGAIEQAKKLCKEFVRVDEIVAPKRFVLDNAKAVDDLIGLGRSAGQRAWAPVKPLFFDQPPGSGGRNVPPSSFTPLRAA